MKTKKMLSLALTGVLSMSLLAGCGGSSSGSAQTSAPSASSSGGSDGEPVKVAMLLTGYINDAGWNQSAYEGLQMAEEEFGVEGAYTEAVPQPDFETVLRDYADQGYDLIIAVGNELSDATLAVAGSFPDTTFAVMNGNSAQAPNVGAYRFNTPQSGFLAGAISAMYSTDGTVGMIGGTTAPHIKDCVDAFAEGAKYIDPDITALTGYTDSMTDVAKGKEMGMAFIEQGADVLCANANSCSLGVIDAAKEKGIRHIGYISDQYDVAPDTVMVSVVQSNQFMIRAIVESVINGDFTPELHLFGMSEGALYLSDYHGHDDQLTDEQKAKIDEIIEGIKDGSLREAGILPKSTFEQ